MGLPSIQLDKRIGDDWLAELKAHGFALEQSDESASADTLVREFIIRDENNRSIRVLFMQHDKQGHDSVVFERHRKPYSRELETRVAEIVNGCRAT